MGDTVWRARARTVGAIVRDGVRLVPVHLEERGTVVWTRGVQIAWVEGQPAKEVELLALREFWMLLQEIVQAVGDQIEPEHQGPAA